MSDPSSHPTGPPRNTKAGKLSDALEGMRQRLATLATSLNDYSQTLARAPGMPPWTVLQTKASIVAGNITNVAEHQAANHDLFAAANVFPLPEFPGRTEAGLLSNLLRKKLDPGLEDWLEEAERWADKWVAQPAKQDSETIEKNGFGQADRSEDGRLDITMEGTADSEKTISQTLPMSYEGWQILWREAPARVVNEPSGNSRELGMVDYTKAERELGVENIKTGLQRELRTEFEYESEDEEEDDDDDEDDEEAEAARQPKEAEKAAAKQALANSMPVAMPMDDYLRFITTGILPSKPAPANVPISNGIPV